MEKTGCKIISGAPATLSVKVLMMMMMMMMMMMIMMMYELRIFPLIAFIFYPPFNLKKKQKKHTQQQQQQKLCMKRV